jgi:hypothetical protein
MQISHQEQIMSRQDQIMSRQEQIMSTIANNHLDLIERLDRYLKTGKDHLHRSLETPDQEQKAEVSSPVSEEITNLRIARMAKVHHSRTLDHVGNLGPSP